MCEEGKNRVNDIVNTEWTGEMEGINSHWERKKLGQGKAYKSLNRVKESLHLRGRNRSTLKSHEKTHSYLSFIEPGKPLIIPSLCLSLKAWTFGALELNTPG